MSYMTGNLQSPRQSKFKEDFSPEEPIVADEDGLYPLDGLIAGTPYHLLDTDGPRPSTEDAGFIRRHRHNLSNISTISNTSTVSDASSGSDISSPSNITSEFSQRIISWYGPTQARPRRCGSPASSIYSADGSEPSSPVAESSPSWPLPNDTATRPDDTDFSTDRLLLVRDAERPLSVSSYASRYRKFGSSTTSLASRNSELSLPGSPMYLAPPRSPLSPHGSSFYPEPPKSPPFPPRRSSRRQSGRPLSQASQMSQASQVSQTSQTSQVSQAPQASQEMSVFEEDFPLPPPRRRFGHRKNASLSSLSSIRRLVPLYEDRVQDTSPTNKGKTGASKQAAPRRPPRPEEGLDFPFHRMSTPSQVS